MRRNKADRAAPADRTAAPRKRGRPRKSVPAVGRSTVLEAAHALLRSRRLAKLTHTEVAHAAQVDEKLVRYYYDSPQEVLNEILDLDIDDLNATMIQSSRPQADVRDLLRARVDALIDFVDKNPNFFRLLVDHVYSGLGEDARARLENVSIEAYARHETMVAQGRASGDFRGDFDPRLLYIAVIGMAEIFVTARPVLELLYGGKLPDLRREYKDFVTNLILRGIQAHADTGRASSRKMKRRR